MATEPVIEAAIHRRVDPASTDGFVVGPTRLAPSTEAGPLTGVRFAVKDLYDVAGTRTGAGNPDRLLDVPVASEHAACVDALIGAGAVLVGKTVTDEFAFSLSGTNIHYGTPRNPAAPGRVPGGSSSGSVSVVADGSVDFALGTDTGGSTRVPASYCGVLGLRTSHGRISGDGVFLLAPSFCALGLFARSASTLEGAWQVLATSSAALGEPRSGRPVRELLVAPELFALADPSVAHLLERAAYELAEKLDVPIRSSSFDLVGDAAALLQCFRTIQGYEAWQLHGTWVRSHRDTFGGGILSRFDASATIDEAAFVSALRQRTEIRQRFDEFLGEGAYLVQPATCGPAPWIDLGGEVKDDLRLRTMMLTSPAGLAGAPALSMPLAEFEGLPLGLALVGLAGDDDAIVRAAARINISDRTWSSISSAGAAERGE